jgi:hypothetical protein
MQADTDGSEAGPVRDRCSAPAQGGRSGRSARSLLLRCKGCVHVCIGETEHAWVACSGRGSDGAATSASLATLLRGRRAWRVQLRACHDERTRWAGATRSQSGARADSEQRVVVARALACGSREMTGIRFGQRVCVAQAVRGEGSGPRARWRWWHC